MTQSTTSRKQLTIVGYGMDDSLYFNCPSCARKVDLGSSLGMNYRDLEDCKEVCNHCGEEVFATNCVEFFERKGQSIMEVANA
jgi:hypothetical protein